MNDEQPRRFLAVVVLTAIAAAMPVVVLAQSGKGPCSVTDIEIVSFNPRAERYGSRNQFVRLILVGELRNRCAVPTGAEIEIVARNAAGVLVDSVRGWPGSTNNIPAGGTVPINFTEMMDYAPGMADFEIRVVSVRTWRR